MSLFVLTVVIVVLVAINVALWKFGFVHTADKPEPVEDRPLMDTRERKAILKRLERWKTEGKLNREEHERFTALCESEWDPR